MFGEPIEVDVERELSEIPAEYQDAFRQALEQELADTEQNRTDTDILTYLRRRRDDFRRGGFIRPDGRPGMVTLNPDALYEQALPELVRSSLGESAEPGDRRRTLLKAGGLVLVALLFVGFALRGRLARSGEGEMGQAAPVVAPGGPATPVPTPPLPEITGVEDSLQTIGGLGGALTIGRPSALEIRYGRTGETIALAIDPSKPTPKGELRFNEATMTSDNPVAVWLFGTVLNYAVGIPDSLVRNVQPGDRVTVHTDTGATLPFVVTETGQGASYDAGRLLSQNRVGLTLFALPAAGEEAVAYALAHYDSSWEEAAGPVRYGIGEAFALGGRDHALTALHASHTAAGVVRLTLEGASAGLLETDSLLLSLTSGREQTVAEALEPDADGRWEAVFELPPNAAGQKLTAELRLLPLGEVALIQLGETPRLLDALETTVAEAWWDSERARLSFTLEIFNPGEGAVYLPADYVRLAPEPFQPPKGGDAADVIVQAGPLPALLEPGDTVGVTVVFPWNAPTVRVQIGRAVWAFAAETAGMPAAPHQPGDG